MIDPRKVLLLMLSALCILEITRELIRSQCLFGDVPFRALIVVRDHPDLMEGAVRLMWLRVGLMSCSHLLIYVLLESPMEDAWHLLGLLVRDGLVIDRMSKSAPHLILNL